VDSAALRMASAAADPAALRLARALPRAGGRGLLPGPPGPGSDLTGTLTGTLTGVAATSQQET